MIEKKGNISNEFDGFQTVKIIFLIKNCLNDNDNNDYFSWIILHYRVLFRLNLLSSKIDLNLKGYYNKNVLSCRGS